MKSKTSISDLEKIKIEIRKTSGILLSLDMEDRWGSKDKEALEERGRAFEKYDSKIEKLRKRLEQKVKRLRKEHPAVLQAWAKAHIQLLNDFISRHEEHPVKYRTELSVAASEIEEWQKFAAGELNDVDQNIFYVHYDSKEFKKIFGFEIK